MSRFNIIMNDSYLPELDETVIGVCKLNEDNYSVGDDLLFTARDILTMANIVSWGIDRDCTTCNAEQQKLISKVRAWEYKKDETP